MGSGQRMSILVMRLGEGEGGTNRSVRILRPTFIRLVVSRLFLARTSSVRAAHRIDTTGALPAADFRRCRETLAGPQLPPKGLELEAVNLEALTLALQDREVARPGTVLFLGHDLPAARFAVDDCAGL